jgi:hypothetical protein
VESDETVLFSLLTTRVVECCLGGSDWFVLGKELLAFLEKIDEWFPRSAEREHILHVHGMQLNLHCFPYEMVPASGVLRMPVTFSRILWTMSLLCSAMADFSDWYRWVHQWCYLTLAALAWPFFPVQVWEDIHWTDLHFSPEDKSSMFFWNVGIHTQSYTVSQSEEHNIIYLEYLNIHVTQFSSTHHICKSGNLPFCMQQN